MFTDVWIIFSGDVFSIAQCREGSLGAGVSLQVSYLVQNPPSKHCKGGQTSQSLLLLCILDKVLNVQVLTVVCLYVPRFLSNKQSSRITFEFKLFYKALTGTAQKRAYARVHSDVLTSEK